VWFRLLKFSQSRVYSSFLTSFHASKANLVSAQCQHLYNMLTKPTFQNSLLVFYEGLSQNGKDRDGEIKESQSLFFDICMLLAYLTEHRLSISLLNFVRPSSEGKANEKHKI
jgi:hypothetical protein